MTLGEKMFDENSLARQYGLEDLSMELGDSTVESGSALQQFNKYADGTVSPKGTDPIKYWEVSSYNSISAQKTS
jgi:hypothetical protein